MTGSASSADDVEEAVAWRHDFHRHPELAYEETRTAASVARLLESWGYRVRTGVSGTGVVGTLGEGGPRIGFRVDIDALPIEEETGAAHASGTKGKMHACGHDGHTAILLLAAKQIARDWSGAGTLHVIFQPAEESVAGAKAMIDDGLFDTAPCDRVFALHNWPGLDQGEVATMAGPMMAAFAVFDVKVQGEGGHAAMPHLSDPVMSATARIATALQEQAARRIDPFDPAVLSVTRIAAGSAYNVTPGVATISGTARWFSDATGDVLERIVEDVATKIASAHGCTARIDYRRRYPATVNTADEATIVRDAAAGSDIPAAISLRAWPRKTSPSCCRSGPAPISGSAPERLKPAALRHSTPQSSTMRSWNPARRFGQTWPPASSAMKTRGVVRQTGLSLTNWLDTGVRGPIVATLDTSPVDHGRTVPLRSLPCGPKRRATECEPRHTQTRGIWLAEQGDGT